MPSQRKVLVFNILINNSKHTSGFWYLFQGTQCPMPIAHGLFLVMLISNFTFSIFLVLYFRFVICLRFEGTLLQDSLQDLKSEYHTYEDIAFGKIKGLFNATDLYHYHMNKLM